MVDIKEFSKIKFIRKREGVYVKLINGEKAQLLLIKLEPGVETNHVHPEEQLGYIISGFAELTIDDNTKICGPGTAYAIPADKPHGFKVSGNKPLTYIEVFSPPKQENIF